MAVITDMILLSIMTHGR